ncbi:MAG: ATP-binding protein [Bacillota bacterium]|nr:ATP-binding protein [Bacillota bacterium]
MQKSIDKKNGALEILHFINNLLGDNWITIKFLRNTKIKVRLMVAFMALSIIPLTLIGVFAYSLSSNTIDSKIRSYSRQLVRETGIKTEDALAKYKNDIVEMTLSDELQKKIGSLYADSYGSFQDTYDLSNILLLKFSIIKDVSFAALILDNGQLINYNLVNDIANTEITGRLKKLADNGSGQDVVWTTETLDSKHYLICIRKIKAVSWSKNLGYLIVGISNDNFLNIYKDIDIGKGSELFVMNTAGKVISSSNKSALGKLYNDKGLINRIVDNKNNDHILDYNNYMISYKEIRGTDWYLVGKIPISFINAEPNRIRSSLIIFILVCLGLSLFLAYLISGSISRPLDKMVFMMKEVKKGNLDFNINDRQKDEIAIVNGNDEISLLSLAFSEMIISLRNAYKIIESRQNELHQLNQNLVQTNSQLIKTNEDLKNAQELIIQSEKLASLGSLVAGVSHEVNTPIGVSVSAASYIKDIHNEIVKKVEENKLSKKEFKSFLDSIHETSNILLTNLSRAADLIGSFKKIAVDQTNEDMREINLYEYIEDVVLSLKHILKKTFIEVIIESEKKELIVKIYPGLLAQLITNLIINSTIHGFDKDQKGLISITTKIGSQNNVDIEYRDNGKGMSKEVQRRIFEPFFTTRRGNGGSGLGMFIVYNIVTKQFNGSIECCSDLGQGVLFNISIPINPKN